MQARSQQTAQETAENRKILQKFAAGFFLQSFEYGSDMFRDPGKENAFTTDVGRKLPLNLKLTRSETPKCGSGRMWALGARGGSAKAPARNNAPGGSTARATCAWRKHALRSSETL